MAAPRSEVPRDERGEISALYGIDIGADLVSHPDWQVTATEEDELTEGADYKYVEVLYAEDGEVRASRNAAVILPGNRTELAYWTRSAPEKTLTVHKGRGLLVVIGAESTGEAEQISLGTGPDGRGRDFVLPPGSFYTIIAAENDSEPLVVSGYYEPPPDWEGLEVDFSLEAKEIDTPDGKLKVPLGFHLYCKR